MFTTLPIFKETKDYKNEAAAYNTLGFIYYYFDDHEDRLKVNLKSLKSEKNCDTLGYARSSEQYGRHLSKTRRLSKGT